MAGKKKTKPPQAAQTDQEPMQTAQETQEQPQTIRPGIDLEDPASSGISGDIVEVNAEGGLNLRIGPGRSYPVAELLEYGTLLTVLGTATEEPLPLSALCPLRTILLIRSRRTTVRNLPQHF